MYDAAARPEHFLRSYADEFGSVEIDSTFYGTPTADRVRKWAAGVPAGFTFSCKLDREITHERRLLDVNGLVAAFYDAVRAFGPKLGCVLAQFDASFTRDEEANLRDALTPFRATCARRSSFAIRAGTRPTFKNYWKRAESR
jgi:uncharacterized protein YecE (DUF72 family)